MLCYVIMFAAHNISTSPSHISHWSHWPVLHPKYSKGSKWSHAKPEPLSTDAPPTTKDQSSNTPTVEMKNQATQYESQELRKGFGGSVEQDPPLPFRSASIPQVPRPPQSSSITTLAQVLPVQVDSSSTPLEAARVTHQPSTPSTTEATPVADNQLDVMPSHSYGSMYGKSITA